MDIYERIPDKLDPGANWRPQIPNASMPSLIAHTITGYAIARGYELGKAVPYSSRLTRRYGWLAIAVLLANLPDLDFIPQLLLNERFHHGPTHSVLFVLVVAATAWILATAYARKHRGAIVALTLMLYASHLILDLLSQGGYGIQLFWPFSSQYIQSPVQIFPPVRYSRGLIDPSHLQFVAFELAYTALVIGAVWTVQLLKRLVEGRRSPSASPSEKLPL
ncbi:MAG: metal-dependent hydrolase [Anaerolineales bacterium]